MNKFNQDIMWIIFWLTLIMVAVYSTIAKADEVNWVTDEQAVKCILGEARGEEYRGMLAVAEAMRNRGRIAGIDGCLDKHFPISQQNNVTDDIRKAAERAWLASESTNLVKGADHWHADYIVPWWAKYGQKTASIGNHIFYKEVYR
jgi:hypothetical protein